MPGLRLDRDDERNGMAPKLKIFTLFISISKMTLKTIMGIYIYYNAVYAQIKTKMT